MKHIIAAFVATALALTAACAQDGGYKNLNAGDAKKLIAEKGEALTVLDVRTPGEFAAGHLKGAKNIDFKADDFAAKLGKLDKTKPYLVHCRSGGRSTASLKTFKELGFTNIIHLDGGMIAWKKADGAVVTP
jgi:rhodanese-related sulfurtransferase